MSKLFSQTLRDVPGDAEVASHQLLLRAGFIRQLAAGIFSNLPLAYRSLSKIEAIIRDEMEKIGGQELKMPVVHPADIWKESGRWYEIDQEMARFKDRNDREMVLGMTHEEIVADLVRKEIRSYRQLPQLIFQIQTKFRDDPRPRAGLIRVREFSMKDSYSLDLDYEGLDRQYQAHYKGYIRIFNRCGLPVTTVRADTGMMGGKEAHEFMALTPIGEDTLLLCDACGYKANRQVATLQKRANSDEDPLPIERIPTPGMKTIDELADFLGVTKERTAKAVFMTAQIYKDGSSESKFVFAVVRGDMEVNETKLMNVIGAREMRPATEEEIVAVGATPGYASPIGLKDALIIVDDLIPQSPNLVAGANETGYHLKNVNYGRDYQAFIVADISTARAGDACPQCGQPMRAVRGVEVGNIFKLGTHYSEKLGCTYLNADGQPNWVVMGSYGIGIGRLLASVAELHHDDFGLTWPVSIAPYQVHLVVLGGKGDFNAVSLADALYLELQDAGIEVLYDDRQESPGIKFNDADLIGVPIRLTVSERAFKAGGFEFKHRDSQEREIVPANEIVNHIKSELQELFAKLEKQVSAALEGEGLT